MHAAATPGRAYNASENCQKEEPRLSAAAASEVMRSVSGVAAFLRGRGGRRRLGPALDHMRVDVEQIERAADRLQHEVVERFRTAVEGGNRRHDDCAVARRLVHQRNMAGVQRRFTK